MTKFENAVRFTSFVGSLSTLITRYLDTWFDGRMDTTAPRGRYAEVVLEIAPGRLTTKTHVNTCSLSEKSQNLRVFFIFFNLAELHWPGCSDVVMAGVRLV